MPDARVLARLRRLPPTDLPDADLLARFLDQRDESAFEALVRRHGPMVRAVCRANLANPADRDDAFQATFLVLVRRAGVIRDRTALAGWLHRVALRVSRKLRAAAKAAPLPDDLAARGEGPPAFDVRHAMDEEIGRLPEKYRIAVQLCYVAGYTTADAAQRLGWAKGTVLTRLAWARKRLRTQLGRRGIGVGVGSMALLAGRPETVGAGLVNATVRAAIAIAAGDELSGRVFNLTEGVLRTMTLNKLKWATGALLVVAALTGVGIGRWTMNTVTAEPGDKKRIAAIEPEPPVKEEPVAAGEAKPGPRPFAKLDADEGEKPREFLVTKPVGVWIRELSVEGGSIRTALRIDEDRITLLSEQAGGNQRVTYAIEGDYSINKESTLFGVITSIDLDGVPDGKETLELEQAAVGQPFSVRFRLDGDTLTLKDLRGFGIGLGSNQNEAEKGLALYLGRYTRSDGKVPARPAPKRVKSGMNFDLFDSPRGRSDAGPAYPVQPQAIPGPVPNPDALPPALPQSSHGGMTLPTRPIAPNANAIEPPTDQQVLKALPCAVGANWDDVMIVKEKMKSETMVPRFFPVVGIAGLNKTQWECRVYFTEKKPERKQRVESVYIDTEQLVLAK